MTNTSKAAALAAYDAGIPSTLPDSNPHKGAVEHHRWGNRSPLHVKHCPVCQRDAAR